MRHKPRVLCIVADISANKLGGAEMHFIEVAKRLSSKYHLTVVTGPDTTIQTLLPKVQIIPISYPHIPNFFGISFILTAYLVLPKKINLSDFDLIWAKQTFPQSPLSGLLKHKQNLPLYVTVQNPLLHLEEYVVKGIFPNFLKLILANSLTPIIKWGLNQANLVSAVSHYSQKKAQEMGVRSSTIIPNGVDTNTLRPSQPPKSKHFKLITTSSLIPRNGIDILITAISLLPNNQDYYLTIAGDGPQLSSLKKLVTKLNLHQQINFLGRVPNSDVPKLLKSHHAFVRPSRFEGFGVSFIEAMACGLPIIATPVGGIPDFLTHKKTGLMSKPENPQSLANQIKLLRTNKKLSSKLRTNGLKLVKSKYTWDTIADQVDQQFHRLLK